MRRVKDTQTLDIFEVPAPVVPMPGSGNYAAQVSELVGAVLKDCPVDRYEVAAQMSRYSGDDVSKHMLDAWSSPARSDHNIPFYRIPLLEEVCQSHVFTDWIVHLRGGRVAYGREAQGTPQRLELNAQCCQAPVSSHPLTIYETWIKPLQPSAQLFCGHPSSQKFPKFEFRFLYRDSELRIQFFLSVPILHKALI